MYAFVYLREWLQQLCEAMHTEASHTDETTGPDGKKRPRVRKSYTMRSLPDARGRSIPMTNDHKMALVCFLAHVNDVEADSSHCFVTVETVAEAVGCGNTKTEGIIKQLRAVGLIARKPRTATSTQTYLYRTPGCWEQQVIDEAPDDQKPAEPVKAVPKAEEPKPSKAEKVALKPALDEPTEKWLKTVTIGLSDPERDGYYTCQIPGFGGSYHFESKTAAEKASMLLADCLGSVKRIARPVLQGDRWYVMTIQRPEIVASVNLTDHYGREITVDRLPKIDGVDEFGMSCAMMRLFDPETQLYQKYVSLFGRGLRNPAGQLVKHLAAIVRTDASISRGFPFKLHDPHAGQQGSGEQKEQPEKATKQPMVGGKRDREIGSDDVGSGVIKAKAYDEDHRVDGGEKAAQAEGAALDWDYKVEEQAERWYGRPEKEMERELKKYYPHLLEQVRERCRRMEAKEQVRVAREAREAAEAEAEEEKRRNALLPPGFLEMMTDEDDAN